MDLNRPLPPLPHPSDFDATDDDYHRQDTFTPASRPRDHFELDDDDNDDNDDNEDDSSAFVPASGMARFARRLARRLERACCLCATYFPLAFVYTLTVWALYVVVHLATTPPDAAKATWVGPWCGIVAGILETLLLWSYTTAVVSSPGSTTNDQGYSTIPASLSGTSGTSLTVKSNGEMRFCKKCQARKPDRAHHCSSCRRCVLKMDHHCPWLANCIGLRNGKAFLLFLIYTTVYSIFCFVVCGAWVWTEVANEATYTTADESLMPVQYIMLCVIGGIVGLVVGLFTGWHLYLACTGQTTIECMEKTRYSSPLRSTMTFTAAATMAGAINNSLGGSTASGHNSNNNHQHNLHDEEEAALFDGIQGAHDDHDDDPQDYGYGDRSYDHIPSAARTMGRRLTYNELERYRAQKRHEEYMDEQDSKKLPHAFDLGLRRNLAHMFGPAVWLWPLPIRTTTGDGWSWEPSPKWLAARDRIKQERDAQLARERAAGWGAVGDDQSPQNAPPIVVTQAAAAAPSRYRRSAPTGSKADRVLGRTPGQYSDTRVEPGPLNGRNVALQRLNAAGRTVLNDDDLFEDDDEEDDDDVKEESRTTSPLRARWMPDPASGLLRKASSSPVHGVGVGVRSESPSLQQEAAASVVSDADDGSVD